MSRDLHVTLYLDQWIDNRQEILNELEQWLPENTTYTLETKIFQTLPEDELSFEIEFLPVCLLRTSKPELLADTNAFQQLENDLYRLKDRIIRHNAIYFNRERSGEQLIIFTLNHCPACDEAKLKLNQAGIPFEEHNPASKIRRQLRVAKAPSFFYENRYLFEHFDSFKHTIWSGIL